MGIEGRTSATYSSWGGLWTTGFTWVMRRYESVTFFFARVIMGLCLFPAAFRSSVSGFLDGREKRGAAGEEEETGLGFSSQRRR